MLQQHFFYCVFSFWFLGFMEIKKMESVKLLNAVSTAKYLGVGRNTLFNLMKDQEFPKPVKLYEGQKKLLWASEALDKFIELKSSK